MAPIVGIHCTVVYGKSLDIPLNILGQYILELKFSSFIGMITFYSIPFSAPCGDLGVKVIDLKI